jgi:hypothetical protein
MVGGRVGQLECTIFAGNLSFYGHGSVLGGNGQGYYIYTPAHRCCMGMEVRSDGEVLDEEDTVTTLYSIPVRDVSVHSTSYFPCKGKTIDEFRCDLWRCLARSGCILIAYLSFYYFWLYITSL